MLVLRDHVLLTHTEVVFKCYIYQAGVILNPDKFSTGLGAFCMKSTPVDSNLLRILETEN